jgi:hypothetical protein
MSGGGLAYDGAGSMFFATGNGYASQLSGTAVAGRQPPTALEEAVVNAKINSDGTLSVIDFFMPWEKQQLDGADKDLGTTPFELLGHEFSCPNVKRMGIVTGKSGKTYVLNLDNLGGYQNGANKLDAAILVFQNENSVYAGAGVYFPYIYVNIIRFRTRVFKFSCDSSGNAQFTVVASTAEPSAGVLGTGHGTTTSLNGADGTGLLWVSDVAGLNLRIYNAVPPSNGANLTMINSFNIPGVSKFTRPVFGDGRAYIGTTKGFFYGFGSPVSLPLNCSSPYEFGDVLTNQRSDAITVTCNALIETTISDISLAGDPDFIISNTSLDGLHLTAGQSFTFQAAFSPITVGPLSADALVNTTNAVTGYTSSTPVTLRGTGRSAGPLLSIMPNTISVNIIAGQQAGGSNQTFLLSNLGDTELTIQNVLFSQTSETGPWMKTSLNNTGDQLGPFTFFGIPATIPGNTAVSATVNYNPHVSGNDAAFLNFKTTGGNQVLDVVAVAGTYPKALIEFERFDTPGEWVKLDNTSTFTFGNVTENHTKQLKLRVTNSGGNSAVPLSITVSKPPFGVSGLVAAENNVDLAEGTILSAGQNATATLYCSVPKSQVNLPSYSGSANWTINTGDPNLGKQFIQFTCEAVAEQVGPLLANGTAQYSYIGCFLENNPGRQLSTKVYANDSNTNEQCISACSAAGWLFAATQYHNECWCGNAIPIQGDNEQDCNFPCSGNGNETCGGNGYFSDHPRVSLFADSKRFNGQWSNSSLEIPASVNGYHYIGCYSEQGGRALTALEKIDQASMTVEMCSSVCSTYSYFSLEYAQECYCGSQLNPAATLTRNDDTACNMNCKGNNSEYCGGASAAQIYNRGGTGRNSTAADLEYDLDDKRMSRRLTY